MRIYTLYHVRLTSIKGRVSEYIKGDLKKEVLDSQSRGGVMVPYHMS